MASSLGDTPTGIRISYVYTPTDLRGRGYASATVAHLTQKHFDCGKERVFLFTDLNNPTSNRIYQAIGYQKAGELNLYKAMRA
jgi:predicted GNAT family acetyltransferase